MADLSRRSFLTRLTAAAAGAVALAKLPAALFAREEPIRLFDGPLTFGCVPIHTNIHCPNDMIYFISSTSFHFLEPDAETTRRLAVITNIGHDA